MEYLVLIALAFIIPLLGFYYFIWFFSLGYSFSIAGIALATLIMWSDQLDIVTILLAVLLFIWGCRLGGFLFYREIKTQYNKILKDDLSDVKKKKPVVKIMTWFFCALLYICQASPLYFRVSHEISVDTLGIVGASLLFLGITVEFYADYVKDRHKKIFPRRFCDVSIYKIVRCPNYFGEILMWTGVFVSGISAYNAWYEWLIACLGYLGILYIMISGTRRLELRQDRNYANDPDFQAYVKKTPILFPFVPLKSVKRHKWFVA